MSSKKTFQFITIQDRNLGDEWTTWHGRLETNEQNSNTGKRFFLGVLLCGILAAGLFVLFLWYMIGPRLEQFHTIMPYLIGFIFLLTWCITALWFLLMVISIITEKDFFFRLGKREYSITFLVPIVFRLGMKFGISRDRLSNSFVKVSNALIRITTRNVRPDKLLILLPRCLQKPLMNKITTFSKSLNISVFTVPGGEKARQIVVKLKPKAIIGIACERDLLTGIQDILPKIPVIGIPNLTPEGPCKNTTIDIHEFEKAVQTFLGSGIHLAGIDNSI